MTTTALFDICLTFIQDAGIPVAFDTVTDGFLPGFSIKEGVLVIDRSSVQFPGDILHEAGHIAVVPAAERHSLDAVAIQNRKDRDAEEMMVIAWTYAACIYLKIDPFFVFHDDGYKNGGREIAENFMQGRYFGVPMLEWTGMCQRGAYPTMHHWLRP